MTTEEKTGVRFEDATETQRQRAAELLIGREVHACVSSMVSDLMAANEMAQGTTLGTLGFDWDDVENMTRHVCPECGEDVCTRTTDEDGDPEEYACTCCDWEGDEPDQGIAEVFEWWIVSGMLWRNLQHLGHPVYDGHGPRLWGRCTTGQSIALDRDIQRIAWDLTWIREEVAS